MRIIPKKTKVSIELFKGLSVTDLFVGAFALGLMILTITSSIPYKLYITCAELFVAVGLISRANGEPNYKFLLAIIRHISYRHHFTRKKTGAKTDVSALSAFTDIREDMIVYDHYYGAAIEIPPIEFRFLSPTRRTMAIDEGLGSILRSLNPSYSANIVKLEKRVSYDHYLENENAKLDELRASFESGVLSEPEYQARCEIIFDRIADLDRINQEERVVAPYYYLVLFDSDKNQLRMQVRNAMTSLERGEMKPKRLNSKELALFLKYSNELDFDEKELDALQPEEYARWAMPQEISVQSNKVILNDVISYTMAVTGYPTSVGDGWLAGVMSIPATKVVVKCRPMEKSKTIRNIDHSIAELRSRYMASGVDSTRMELESHISTLEELLAMMQSESEVLLNTDIYVTCYDLAMTERDPKLHPAENSSLANITDMRRTVKRLYREDELRLGSLQFNQMKGFIGAQVSGYDPFAASIGRGIPGATVAGGFPWIFAHVADPKGIKLGSEEGVPVFIDMFRRDAERVNSNVVIVGKSGSGKSYAAKSILANLAADNSKIFVLDPENEYSELADNLHGKFINVGNASQGRINPFHIITSLEDDTGESNSSSYAMHLEFLEEFLQQILPECEKDAREYLNALVDRVYTNKGITAETNFSRLTPEDYPTFDDLYDIVLQEFQSTDNEYLRAMLRTLINYVSKFSTGGRNAILWNGPSTITTDENFTVFNFQSLLAGGNQSITNAQMLLVLKYIDNEIIKNRDYNNKYHLNRKIVVVIDEAHVFIDEKYPIALDFMFQLAKRIRKYNGMQVVITQNIKDFVGSEELSRKSAAIINACQYSFIFPLAPNDMSDLCKLYEKAGGINEQEQEKIMTAPQGNAFVVLSPTSHSSFQVEVPEEIVTIFQEKGVPSAYFSGEEGEAAWEDYVGESRARYEENRVLKISAAPAQETINKKITLSEVSVEEYETEQETIRAEQQLKAQEAETRRALETPGPEKEEFRMEERSAEENGEEFSSISVTGISSTERSAPIPAVNSSPASNPLPEGISSPAAAPSFMAGLTGGDDEHRQAVGAIGQIIYDALVNDVLKRIQGGENSAEVLSDLVSGKLSQKPSKETSAGQEAFREESEETEDDWDSLEFNFDDSDEEDQEFSDSDEETEEATGFNVVDYIFESGEDASETEDEAEAEDEDEDETEEREETGFEVFGLSEENDSPQEENDDSDSFDIEALIAAAEEQQNSVNVLERMEDQGEQTRTISLAELIQVIKQQ